MNVSENSHLLGPNLKANSIYLRPAKISDYQAIKQYRQNIENCRFIRPPENDEETLKLVKQFSQPWVFEEGRWNGLVICLHGDDNVIGEIVFNVEDWKHQRVELGYRINGSYSGQGVCSEAANLLIDYLFSEIGVFKIVAKCDPRNIGSYRVMEKLGFKREAFFKAHYLIGEEWTDQLDYGLLASDWLSNSI